MSPIHKHSISAFLFIFNTTIKVFPYHRYTENRRRVISIYISLAIHLCGKKVYVIWWVKTHSTYLCWANMQIFWYILRCFDLICTLELLDAFTKHSLQVNLRNHKHINQLNGPLILMVVYSFCSKCIIIYSK